MGITPPNSTTEGWPGVPAGGQEVLKIDQRKTGDPAIATFYLYDVAGNLLDVWQPAVNVPYASTIENDGPQLYWRLGDSSTTATDSSGNGNTGTYSGSTYTQGTTGALSGDSDTSTSFNGGGVASAGTFNDAKVTVEAWVYLKALPSAGDALIAGFDQGGGVTDKTLYVDSSGHLYWYVYDGALKTITGPTLSLNQWIHVVGTDDGTTSCLYVDGSLVGSTAAGNSYASYTAPNFHVGWSPNFYAIDAVIDEVAVYDHALSASQISAQYNAALGTQARPHWHYTYDSDGNQLTQVDPKGNVTSFTYDELDRQLSRTLPDGQTGGSNATHETETFTYDQYGNELTHTDFKGNLTTNTYYTSGPHAGLLQKALYQGPGQSPETVNYTYDSLNRSSTINDPDDGLTSYTYDPITGKTASIVSPEGTINYVYNPATGQEVRMIASHSGTVTDETDYAYDQQGRLTNVYAVVLQGTVYASFAGLDPNGNPTFTGGTPLTTAYTYDPLGNLASRTDPDSTQTSYTYDVDSHLTALATVNTATGKPLFAESYDLDDNGLRKDVIDTRYNTDGSVFSQTKLAWTYDDDQRLTNETLTVLQGGSNAPAAYSDTFKYDLSNNRTEEDITGSQTATVAYTYNGDDQLKTETRTGNGAYAITYGYDNNGSLISQVKTGTGAETDSYVYDARNRMIEAFVNGAEADYAYNDDGVRIAEQTSTGVVYYLNDPQNPTGYTKAIEETADPASATILRAYLLGLNVIVQSNSTNGLLYLMKDGHGSTRALLNSSAAIIEQYNYDAFGTLLTSTGAQADASAALTQWLFAGDGIYDSGTGWRYNLARYVDGFHFTIADPRVPMAGDVGNANVYLYVGGNPVNSSDPFGLFTSEFGILAHATIAGRYQAEHPGAIVNPTTGVLSALKPDIFDAFYVGGGGYAEIKPLSFSGITQGIEQIESYDEMYGPNGVLHFNFHRITDWPRGFETTVVDGDWIGYVNIDGLIFYTDAFDDIEELKQIRRPQDLYKLLRDRVKNQIKRIEQFAEKVAKKLAGEEEADLEETAGDATLNSELGDP